MATGMQLVNVHQCKLTFANQKGGVVCSHRVFTQDFGSPTNK